MKNINKILEQAENISNMMKLPIFFVFRMFFSKWMCHLSLVLSNENIMGQII